MIRPWVLGGILAGLVYPSGCAEQELAANTARYVHVELWKIRTGDPVLIVEKLFEDMQGLIAPIPDLMGLWVGRPVPLGPSSDEKIIADYDVGVVFLFTSQKGLGRFRQHPAYAEFQQLHGEILEVRTIDFSPYSGAPVR